MKRGPFTKVEDRKLRKLLKEHDEAISNGKGNGFFKKHNMTHLDILELKRELKWNHPIRKPGKSRRKSIRSPKFHKAYQETAYQNVHGGKQTRMISNISIPVGEKLSKTSLKKKKTYVHKSEKCKYCKKKFQMKNERVEHENSHFLKLRQINGKRQFNKVKRELIIIRGLEDDAKKKRVLKEETKKLYAEGNIEKGYFGRIIELIDAAP